MAEISKYCAVWDYDISDVVYTDGVTSSNGGAGVEEIVIPGRSYGDVRSKGRAPKRYRINARSWDRTELEILARTLNTCPEDAEFYPYDAERFGIIASCHGGVKAVDLCHGGKNFYEIDGEIVCREAWLYGPDQGLGFLWNSAIPRSSDLLTNAGHERSPIGYMQFSGARVSTYTEDLSVRITPGTSSAEHDRELLLCNKLLRGDIFEVNWRGDVWHSFEAEFVTLPVLALDVQSKLSGGSITSGVLTLDDSDYLMIPFHGPLPIYGEPKAATIELTVDALTGDGGTIWKATETDLSDIEEIDHDDLVVGQNTIYIPDVAGEQHLAIGIKAAASGSVDISALKGMVKRYIAPSKMPYADPDEEFKIRLECTAGSELRFSQVCYNDRYWY